MKHIYDPSFRYTPSHETNIRATFERLRRERQGGGVRPLRIAHRLEGSNPQSLHRKDQA